MKIKLLMVLKIWLVIYPSITFFLFVFGKHLAAFPLYQRTLIITICLVPWMIFAGIPLVDFLFRRIINRK